MPIPRSIRSALAALLAALLAGAAVAAGAPAPPGPADPAPDDAAAPRLVVLLVVDQMRADYLDRLGSALTGGLGRLAREGAWFTHAAHDHAITETAPGHSVLLAGRYPRSTGIVANLLGVEDAAAPLVGTLDPPPPGTGASPHRFRGTTLVDWLQARDRRTRALAVSMKDRGAILPLGRARSAGPDGGATALATWYDPGSGRFVTSRWYADSLPRWLAAVDDSVVLPRLAALEGATWAPVRPAGAEPAFHYRLPDDLTQLADAVRGTPFVDELTLAVALAGVRALGLGRGPAPDVLVVSLSATDVVGHGHGPDAPELRDQLLRLDRSLGAFLDTLGALVDPARTVVALTGDHGVTPLPERARPPADTAARPRRVDGEAALAPALAWLARQGVPAEAVALESGALFVDRRRLAAARVPEDSLVSRAAAALLATPGVLRADRPRDLARADTVRDVVARRWLHMLPPEWAVPLVVTLRPGSVWGTRTAAEHGSPHDDDALVPLVLWGAPFARGRHDAPVRVVDLAPTLARVLGVRPLEPLDGRVLDAALDAGR